MQRDRVIIREKRTGRKKEILEGLLAQDVDLEISAYMSRLLMTYLWKRQVTKHETVFNRIKI